MCALLSKLFGSKSGQNAVDATPEMKQALSFIKDSANMTEHSICTFSINSEDCSTAIDAEIHIIDPGPSYRVMIDDFRNYKSNAIAKSVEGRITMDEMRTAVQSMEQATNSALMSSLFGSYEPFSYPFSHLTEFLSCSGDDMVLKYPVVSFPPEGQKLRGKFLRELRERCSEQFRNCKIINYTSTCFIATFN